MKNEIGHVAIVEFVGLKPKMKSFLVENDEYEKTKNLHKNVVATMNHNQYRHVVE